MFRPAAGEVKPTPPGGIPPVAQWSETFQRLGPEELAELLAQIEAKHPDLYAKWSLSYLHARALLEDNEPADAAQKLAPYLAPNHPWRDLALYHQAEIHDARDEHAQASQIRHELIFKYAKSVYRDVAIDEETEHLATLADTKPLLAFATRLGATVDAKQRRELDARLVEALVREGQLDRAMQSGFALLKAGTTDDASDRVSRSLDRPELIRKMTPEQLATMGESFRNHRHFDRAVALLTLAVPKLPARFDDLQFALGRSYFGAEQFVEAQQTYQRGAAMTKVPKEKVQFLWHAARCAQLRNDDATAERLMTAAIAVPGKFPATLAALTQRIRTRIEAKRFGEAAGDVVLLRKMAGNERALLEGTLAYALGMLAANNPGVALSALNTIPPALMDEYDRPELAYWRARALEGSNPPAAFAEYLKVLRASVPTHYAYFARQRLDSAAMAPKLAQELQKREAQVAALVGAKKYADAKPLQTDRILLSSKDRVKQLQVMTAIYRELPAYREILELTPKSLPVFPIDDPDRATLLMAMGLYDEAVDQIESRYALRPRQDGLTRSLALNRGMASRESIYAVEVLMKTIPDDYLPDLLPQTVRQLLYPRYFYDFISADAERFKADPTLVLSIMREESRFNPRAKSEAAARGLLQFIITTARDIGRDVGLVEVDPEDLYDPRIIIRLGAKYVAELAEQLGGNRYRVAAAYNAGPKQVALWSRLQAAPGDDYFLSSVNFDETKHYIRKVMNSYERYREWYGAGGAAGGLRAEP